VLRESALSGCQALDLPHSAINSTEQRVELIAKGESLGPEEQYDLIILWTSPISLLYPIGCSLNLLRANPGCPGLEIQPDGHSRVNPSTEQPIVSDPEDVRRAEAMLATVPSPQIPTTPGLAPYVHSDTPRLEPQSSGTLRSRPGALTAWIAGVNRHGR
jgi:hypothetical protein